MTNISLNTAKINGLVIIIKKIFEKYFENIKKY